MQDLEVIHPAVINWQPADWRTVHSGRTDLLPPNAAGRQAAYVISKLYDQMEFHVLLQAHFWRDYLYCAPVLDPAGRISGGERLYLTVHIMMRVFFTETRCIIIISSVVCKSKKCCHSVDLVVQSLLPPSPLNIQLILSRAPNTRTRPAPGLLEEFN